MNDDAQQDTGTDSDQANRPPSKEKNKANAYEPDACMHGSKEKAFSPINNEKSQSSKQAEDWEQGLYHGVICTEKGKKGKAETPNQVNADTSNYNVFPIQEHHKPEERNAYKECWKNKNCLSTQKKVECSNEPEKQNIYRRLHNQLCL